MHFRAHATGPELAPYVRLLWRVSGSADGACGSGPQYIPSDGCMEIILHVAGASKRCATLDPETYSIMLGVGGARAPRPARLLW
jgi:hypothetical protein